MIHVARCTRHGVPLDFLTLEGQLVEHCDLCERRRRGVCLDCGGRTVGAKWRCGRCERTHRYARANARRHRVCRLRRCDQLVEPGSKRRYCSDRCARAAKNARYRKKWKTDAGFRARRLARKTAWRDTIEGRRSYLQSKRRGRLTGRQGYTTRAAYLAAMSRANRRRQASHRAWAHEHQTRYVGSGAQPKCATCGTAIAWNGRGRPRKYCPPHHPWRRAEEAAA